MKRKQIVMNLAYIACFVPMTIFAASFDIVKKEGTIYFNGEINGTSAQVLKKHFQDGITKVIVNSEGGSAEDGLFIAKQIAEKKVSVVVDKYCLSSCANYLFIAAHSKSLSPNAVLGFHGGIFGGAKNKNEKSRKKNDGSDTSKSIHLFRMQDAKFFNRIGFDTELIRVSYEYTKLSKAEVIYKISARGQTYLFESRKDAVELLSALMEKKEKYGFSISVKSTSSTKMYFPSKETLLKYGVKGIREYPYPENRDEMDRLAKTISTEFELVGDFESMDINKGHAQN